MLHFAASELGLHCLHMSPKRVSSLNTVYSQCFSHLQCHLQCLTVDAQNLGLILEGTLNLAEKARNAFYKPVNISETLCSSSAVYIFLFKDPSFYFLHTCLLVILCIPLYVLLFMFIFMFH